MRKRLMGAVLNGPRRGESKRNVMMGVESLTVGRRSYRQIHVSELLVKTLFGDRYNKFELFEQRKYGKGGGKKRLFHICSRDRMRQLFVLNGWSGIEFDGESGVRTCCGKVYVRRRVDNNLLGQAGFILRETQHWINVKLENREEIWLQKPLWDKHNGYLLNKYISNSYTITEYDPVRLYFSVYGELQILFHRITFRKHNNNLVFE